MKVILNLALLLAFGLNLQAQDTLTDPNAITFTVIYFDSFTFKDGEPKEKGHEFDITIKPVGLSSYKACYNDIITECMPGLEVFRTEEIYFEIQPVSACFTYTVNEENEIAITDKQEIKDQMNAMIETGIPEKNKKELKRYIEEFEYYLEYEEELDAELVKQVSLIHEMDGYDIPVGKSGSIDHEKDTEEIDTEGLAPDEKAFLESIDWETLEQIDIYRTFDLGNNLVGYDRLQGTDVVSSDNRADFKYIADLFFEDDLNIFDFKDVTLVREQRHMTKGNSQLYLLKKDRMTMSRLIRKITRIEIRRKE
ncbi:MAG: hypothetical protein AAF502_09635 [Bacteroidota bacterium]